MITSFLLAGLGGALIGASALLIMAFHGKVTGISSILFEGISFRETNQSINAWLFISGLAIGAGIYYIMQGSPFPSPIAPLHYAVAAGLLVGFGSKLGSGCTSGHGVCGLSLFSFRSLVSTLVFMSFGIITVSLLRHVF